MKKPILEDDFFAHLSNCRVTVWGLGLMGGSLAMALKGKCAGVDGIDQDPTVAALALSMGVVERAVTDPREVLGDSDLIVLATPARVILESLDALPRLCSGSAVVMDLGSTKERICEAMARLPERFDPLGGHPMCGKEKSSLRHADPHIYHQATFALAALQRTSQRARSLAEEVARAAGSNPLWVDPGQHDGWVAATSHVPFLLACALVQATPDDAAALVGPGFRGATRLAGSSTQMMADITATNGANIRAALRAVIDQLEAYDTLLASENTNLLSEQFEQASARYRGLLSEAR